MIWEFYGARLPRQQWQQIRFLQLQFPRKEKAVALRLEGLLLLRAGWLPPHRGARPIVGISLLLHFPSILQPNRRLVSNHATCLKTSGSDGFVTFSFCVFLTISLSLSSLSQLSSHTPMRNQILSELYFFFPFLSSLAPCSNHQFHQFLVHW